MKRYIGMLLSVVMVIIMGAVPAVMAEDIEVECEACYELLTRQDVIYNEDGEAMCIYCDEFLSQNVLDELFYEEEEVEDIECPNCLEIIPEDIVEYTEDGILICPFCDMEEEEEIYETDDPDYYVTNPDENTSIQLNTSEWAQAEAGAAYKNNLIPFEMLGVDLKTDVTREQFAAIAVTLYERITGRIADDSTEELPFTDCKATGTYTKYVAAAYKLGVTNGTSDTTFAPEQIITREQLATMLYRVITRAEADGAVVEPVDTAEVTFEDDQAISDYAKDSVYYMAQRGIIKGMNETEFAPQGVATKEQAILISNRIVGTLY